MIISLDVENRKTFIEMDSVVGKGKTCFPNINSGSCLVFLLILTKSFTRCKTQRARLKNTAFPVSSANGLCSRFCCSQWSPIVFTWPNHQLKASFLIHLWLQILSRILCALLVFCGHLFKNSKQKVLQKQFNYCPIIGRFKKHVLCLKRTRSLLKASEMVFQQCFRLTNFSNGFPIRDVWKFDSKFEVDQKSYTVRDDRSNLCLPHINSKDGSASREKKNLTDD